MKLLDNLQLTLNPTAPDVVAFVGGGGKTSSLCRLAQEIVDTGRRVLMTVTTHLGPEQLQRAPAYVIAEQGRLPLAEVESALAAHRCCLIIGGLGEPRVRGVAPAFVDQLVTHAKALDVAAIVVEADGSRGLPFKAPADHEPAVPASTSLLVPVMGLDALGAPLDEAHVHRPAQVRHLLNLTLEDGASRLTPEMAARLLMHPQGGAKLLPQGARLLPLLNKAEGVPHRIGARLIAHYLAQHGQSSLIGAVGQAAKLDQSDPVLERWSPIAAVVLAAGQSSRMGRPKQLEVVDGEPMVVRAVRTALQSEVAQVFVITGAYVDAVTEVLSPLLQEANGRIQFVHNADWQTGQASSIRTAVQAFNHPLKWMAAIQNPVETGSNLAATQLPITGAEFIQRQWGAALFLPTDQPFVPPLLLQQLIRTWRTGARLVAPLVDGQVRGAPALFDRTLWPEMLALQGDIGARPLLQKYRGEIVTIPTPTHLLRDIDTPEDL
ncbi:MAG: selenium cofactor biosynthesis protein YqeC [Caldilineaceae bacterium]